MLQVRKTKKVLANFPRGFWRFPTKFQLFKKECCPRAEDRPIFEDLRLRGQGQGQGLDLRGQGQGQGLQNVSSRTSSRPRTSSRTPPLPIYATSFIMFALPISKPRFKSIIFNQNSPKMKLFLQKNAKFSSAGSSAPRPPCLRRLGAFPPNSQIPAAGGFAPRPPKQPPHCEFLATRLDHTKGMFYSFVVGLHPTLGKFLD